MTNSLLVATDLSFSYPSRRADHAPRVLDSVSFAIEPGTTLGLVGESGSGKSTLGRVILGLEPGYMGTLDYRGRDVASLSGAARAQWRREVQVVFQDVGSTFNPRIPIVDSVAIGLRHNGGLTWPAARSRARELLADVHLDPREFADRLPHQLSGGQRQRAAIARSLASSPALIVADEPTSALDVSVRSHILHLIAEIQQKQGVAFLFITHDLVVARAVSHEVLVLRAGRTVEYGTADRVLEHPESAYARELIAASPRPDPRLYRDGPKGTP